MKTATKKYSRREKERLKRVELILDAAESLFFEKGFVAATMIDIGDAAEFSRASLYNYFPSKEAIYVAILERALDTLTEGVRKSVQGEQNAVEKIENLKDSLLSFVRHRQTFFHLYFITRAEALPYLDEQLARRLQAKTKKLEGIFHDLYREGVKKGELQPLDPVAMGDIFFAQIIGLLMMNRTEKLDPPLTANVNQATAFFLDSIRKR